MASAEIWSCRPLAPDRSDPSVSKKVPRPPLAKKPPAKRIQKKSASKRLPKKSASGSSAAYPLPSSPELILAEPRAAYIADADLHAGQFAMPFIAQSNPDNAPRIEPRPFLKWAGGKTSLISQLTAFFPARIDRYFEPFLGGGAVFFFLKHRFPHLRAFLRDTNRELINAYRAVRDRPADLMLLLDGRSARFRAEGDPYYYAIRSQHDLTDDLARAARTIFLNKTCFNGLWRVNARGEYNSPVGSNKNPGLYDRAQFLAASAGLQDAQLETQDFCAIAAEARRGDLSISTRPTYQSRHFLISSAAPSQQFRHARWRIGYTKPRRVIATDHVRGEAATQHLSTPAVFAESYLAHGGFRDAAAGVEELTCKHPRS